MFRFDLNPQHGIRGKLGLFMELMWAQILGGRLGENFIFQKNGVEQSFTYQGCNPDIFLRGGKWLAESKAVGSGSELKLVDCQIERYEILQLDPLHKQERVIYFILTRHNLKNLEHLTNAPVSSMLDYFSKNILYSVVFPFSVAHELHASRDSALIYRWDPSEEVLRNMKRVYDPMTRVKSRPITELFQFPEKTLEAFGMYSSDYTFRKGWSPYLEVNGLPIESFPVVFIEDRNHKEWLERFREEHKHKEVSYEIEIPRHIEMFPSDPTGKSGESDDLPF
jgi:hypothetical protein